MALGRRVSPPFFRNSRHLSCGLLELARRLAASFAASRASLSAALAPAHLSAQHSITPAPTRNPTSNTTHTPTTHANRLTPSSHDVESPSQSQITIYAGRGLLVESRAGNTWLTGTAVEHHVKYQYQFAHTANIFAGQIQTETAYYQPNPSAPLPFPYNAVLSDPVFVPNATVRDGNVTIPASEGWGLRILDSSNILIYGAGLYSFFDNYSTTCSDEGNGERCQSRIFSLEMSTGRGVSVYNLNTVGTHWQIAVDGRNVAYYGDNLDGFVDTVALFRD